MRCRFCRPSPTATRPICGRTPSVSASEEAGGLLVVPAHQAAPGEGHRPRLAQGGGHLLPSPGREKTARPRDGGSNRSSRSSGLHVPAGRPQGSARPLRGHHRSSPSWKSPIRKPSRAISGRSTRCSVRDAVSRNRPSRWAPTVRIVTGPLTGVVGKVIRRGKGDQFVAVVRFLGPRGDRGSQDWQVERVTNDRDLSHGALARPGYRTCTDRRLAGRTDSIPVLAATARG